MNFFNRAIKNVTRKISKSILLILTFFLIGNLVIIGLSVANASEQAKTLTRQKMRAVATFGIDYNAFYEAADAIEDEDERQEFYNNYPVITKSDIDEILKDQRVKTVNANSTSQFYAIKGGIDFVHLGNGAEENLRPYGNDEEVEYAVNDMYGGWIGGYADPVFMVKSNFFPNMIEFEDGGFTITKGRFYTSEEINDSAKVIVISEALAELNGLDVGDNVELCTQYLTDYYKEAGITEEDTKNQFEVIGIYSHIYQITPDKENFDYAYPTDNVDNLILMPGTTQYNLSLPVEQKMFDYGAMQNPDDEWYSNPENRPSAESIDKQQLYDVTILLNDPLEVDGFAEDYKGKVGEYKMISVNNEQFKTLSKPLDTLSDYANFIVWLVVINAIVIITLVTALTLKTREYEIGVLLSVGASKIKVVLQFFIELALVAIVGFTLAVGTGSFASKKVGSLLLDNQIASSDVSDEDYYYDDGGYNVWGGYDTDISLNDLVSEYDATISPIIIVEIYIVGLAIVLISVFIPSIMIMRFNPKKILMNQQ